MIVDTHAHIFFKDYQTDFDEMIKRATDAGVGCIVSPGTDLPTSRMSVELAEKYSMVYACVGFHPHDAAQADDRLLGEIESLSHHRKVVAIGEIGLDYHYNYSPQAKQRDIFAAQIDIAIRRDLPIVVHSREAELDTLSIVEAKTAEAPLWRKSNSGVVSGKGVFHCFPGDVQMAERVISRGYFISIPGPVTFAAKSGKQNQMADVVANISLDHILLETDSPYLTPVPLRGKRNEPSYLIHIARKIADVKGCSFDEVSERTTKNAEFFFGFSISA
jgi:TatD DNase family protein